MICDPIETLAVEFVERQRSGEFLSVPEYAQEHPEAADRIRELFPEILALEALKPLTNVPLQAGCARKAIPVYPAVLAGIHGGLLI